MNPVKKTVLTAAAGMIISGLTPSTGVTSPRIPEDWYKLGEMTVEKNKDIADTARADTRHRAKNIILFLADGMGISTVTAARILEGQLKGMDGEENQLFFEGFPNLALAKTYNTNQQTPDSAGTMTAIMTGVKTKAGVLSVNQNVVRGDCATVTGNELVTALELAEIIGMSTGVISTARITHATPGATYAHTAERNFEDDRDASRLGNPAGCVDIARQLIEFPERFHDEYPWVNGIEVAMGGGRRSFLPRDSDTGKCLVKDPEDGSCERLDGRDLVQEWLDNYPNPAYVYDQAGFEDVDAGEVDHLLGLFEPSHMEYEVDRETDDAGEPSLSEMTGKAIEVLSKNPEGFFLHVEGGRVDHAHHATNPYRALTDTIEFARAIKKAYEMTDRSDTLIMVTADHSHVFTLAGYPTRGNPILGKLVSNDSRGNPEPAPSLAKDGWPYTTLGYTNGRGYHFLPNTNTADAIHGESIFYHGRADLREVDTEHEGFHSETLVPLRAETHGGEDVAVYAAGPGSGLVNGVMEQNALYHVMNVAGCLEGRAARRGWSRE